MKNVHRFTCTFRSFRLETQQTMIRRFSHCSFREIQCKMSTTCRIAVIQMTSTSDKLRNRSKCQSLLEKAKSYGAQAAFLPEAFDFIGESAQQTVELAESSLNDGTISFYQSLAAKLNMSLSLGGFHEALKNNQKLSNTHIFISSKGQIIGRYAKAHLFDVEIPERGIRLKESDYVQAGRKIAGPVPLLEEQDQFQVGLAICYDLRFPQLAMALCQRGANILTFPSAFTVATGSAGHWSTLLKARAIENQCYVVAAAQTGRHNPKRSSYGHACVIDPWGTVIAECPEGEEMVVAELSLDKIEDVKKNMPVDRHRRNDLYALATADNFLVAEDEHDYDQKNFKFADIDIPGKCVVFASRCSLVIVNRKPVVPGHLLVIPKSPARRVQDLDVDQVTDLFLTVQTAQKLSESFFQAESSTLSVQDGPDAGQTVAHVHVHVLPRKPGDFANNDDIYNELSTHDKGDNVQWRSYEEMSEEASRLRQHFRKMPS